MSSTSGSPKKSSTRKMAPRLSMTQTAYWKTAPKRFCQYAVRKFSFWMAVAAFALLEPVLCSQVQTTLNLVLQTIVLAISTFLYLIQIIGVATTEWDRIQAIQALGQFGSIFVHQSQNQLTLVKLFVFFTAEGEFLVEGAMILAGWILIFWHPGLAILRCFRVFRLLWFYEVQVFKRTTMKYLKPIFGEGFVSRSFKVLKFAIKALSALGDEIFRLTPETRGGLLLIMMIFYSAFVLGAAIYTETQGAGPNCESIGMCTYTLMRLTFFDGNGFDFAYFLVGGYKILFFIVMLYMCITSFGIINGLVGIFGTLFATASSQAFEEEDGEGRYGKVEEEQVYSSSDEEGENDDNVYASVEKGGVSRDSDGDYDEKVVPLPLSHLTEDKNRSAADLMASVDGRAPPMTEKQIEEHLQDVLGTQHVSHFAIQEFQAMQQKNSPRVSPRNHPRLSPRTVNTGQPAVEKPPPIETGSTTAVPSSGKRRFSIKDVAEKVSGKHKPRVAEAGGTALFESEAGNKQETLEHLETKQKPKPAGIFGASAAKKEKETHGAPHHNSQLELKSMMYHMQSMQQKIDQQQETMAKMLQHIMLIERKLNGDGAGGDESKLSRPPTASRGTGAGTVGRIGGGGASGPKGSVAEIVPFSNDQNKNLTGKELLELDDAESVR